jgi:hypothetical protein
LLLNAGLNPLSLTKQIEIIMPHAGDCRPPERTPAAGPPGAASSPAATAIR